MLSFSGAPFTLLTLSAPAISFQIDNLVAATVTVPEPFSLAVLGAGLVGLAAVRRRTRD